MTTYNKIQDALQRVGQGAATEADEELLRNVIAVQATQLAAANLRVSLAYHQKNAYLYSKAIGDVGEGPPHIDLALQSARLLLATMELCAALVPHNNCGPLVTEKGIAALERFIERPEYWTTLWDVDVAQVQRQAVVAQRLLFNIAEIVIEIAAASGEPVVYHDLVKATLVEH